MVDALTTKLAVQGTNGEYHHPRKGWVFLNEAEIGQGSDHPPAFNRFREASALFQGLGFRSPALENATYLFKVVFDPEAVSPSFENPSEGFDWMVARLEQLFPR